MSMVRFAMICDDCGARSREYGGWCSCRECMNDVCDACIVPGSDDQETGRALCIKCDLWEKAGELVPVDCPECLGPCTALDNLGTCGSERCRRQTLQAQSQEYGGGE